MGAGKDLIVRVRVSPRASQSVISGLQNGEVCIRTTAAPADGAANADVIRQLANAFGVPKSAVQLLRGQSSRHKQLRIAAPRIKPDWLDTPKAS
ncbi:MAG: DUF167 family protein [Woeseia sp.]